MDDKLIEGGRELTLTYKLIGCETLKKVNTIGSQSHLEERQKENNSFLYKTSHVFILAPPLKINLLTNFLLLQTVLI